MRLEGRCVLVTGAASGLGRATVQALSAAGATLVLVDIITEPLQHLAAQLGEHALAVPADICDHEQIEAAVHLAGERFGPVYAAINCAGIASSAKTVSNGKAHDLELWRRVVEVNLTGTFNVVRLLASRMIDNPPDPETGERGVIVNTASIAAFDGQRGQVAYAASKAGVVGLSLSVARDLGEHAIRCVAIAPGLFDTEMSSRLPGKGIEALRRGLLYPDRMGRPDEFAAFVCHVIDNPYFNGSCLRLDGAARLPA
ncbi:SDR family NAD(P)-dependent oxidoreductase [Mesorhizobium sp. M1163]|uniref:SDR family NAD(P)-dependent oxidoreductase n=1 Tax=Mesorhizobium sp. M1163 TaxID=2957065 RepID=UPI00333D4FE9